MKFKNDGCGWRDLTITNANEELQVSIPEKGKGSKPFLYAKDGDSGSIINLSRKQLRSLATKILKELDQ